MLAILAVTLTLSATANADPCESEESTLIQDISSFFGDVDLAVGDLRRPLSHLTEATYTLQLHTREAYILTTTGMSLAELERHQRAAFAELIEGNPLTEHYDRELLREAAWASAVYESLARTPGEDVTDRAQEARGVHASMGAFQAYSEQTSRALTSARVRAWVEQHGDSEARKFIGSIAGKSQTEIREMLTGVFSPLHSSPTLSLIGKMQLTLDYIEDIDRKNPVVRRLPADALRRIWADAETGSSDHLYTGTLGQGGAGRLQHEAQTRPGRRLDIPAGHDRMHRAMDALGISYLRENFLTLPD